MTRSRNPNWSKYQWKPGKSGNPKGVSQQVYDLNKQFLRAVRRHWRDKGDECIAQMIKDDPGSFVRLMASMVPKSVQVEHDHDIAVTWVQAIQAMPPMDAQGRVDYDARPAIEGAIEGSVVQEGDAVPVEPKQ